MMLMHIMKIKKYVFFAEMASSLVCVAIFLYLMIGVVEKFNKKITTTGIRIKQEESIVKHLPCITFCPAKAFRTRGLFFTDNLYFENTFNLTDIFDEASVILLTNKTLYNRTEVR
jgi:hypothetical protein